MAFTYSPKQSPRVRLRTPQGLRTKSVHSLSAMMIQARLVLAILTETQVAEVRYLILYPFPYSSAYQWYPSPLTLKLFPTSTLKVQKTEMFQYLRILLRPHSRAACYVQEPQPWEVSV